MRLSVYAVTPTPTAGRRRASVAPRQAIAAGRVTAVAGWSRRDPIPSPANLRRHDAVVRALWSTQAAVLPARFGTTFGSIEELKTALNAREASLRASLARVRGRAQMTVRLLSGSALKTPVSTSNPTMEPASFGTPKPATSGTAYLRALAAEAARSRVVPGFEPLRDAVRRWVRDEQVDKADVITVYHLIPRRSAAAYRRALDRAAVAAGMRVVITGPHPPYAFA